MVTVLLRQIQQCSKYTGKHSKLFCKYLNEVKEGSIWMRGEAPAGLQTGVLYLWCTSEGQVLHWSEPGGWEWDQVRVRASGHGKNFGFYCEGDRNPLMDFEQGRIWHNSQFKSFIVIVSWIGFICVYVYVWGCKDENRQNSSNSPNFE